jgi:hypothetical protein
MCQTHSLSRTDILDANAICLVVLLFTILLLLRILVPPLFLQLFQFPFVQKLQNSVKEISFNFTAELC